MANSFAKISKYIALLDEVYKQSSKTAVLEATPELVRQGAQANQILIPKIDMDGLGDYSRTDGYVSGDASLTWETKTFDYDRGRRFTVDAMDDEETAGLAFGKLASEFVRTKVVPELDAYRFATYAAAAGTTASAVLSAGADVVSAITTANSAMDDAEVNAEGRFLFITPTLKNLITTMDTTKSREMLDGFEQIIPVPSTRFYSAISMLSGKVVTVAGESVDETAGGYTKASSGKNLNFMIVQKNALIQYTKHNVNKIIPPSDNQSSDGWLFFYRAYGIAEVYANKTKGIYAHLSTT